MMILAFQNHHEKPDKAKPWERQPRLLSVRPINHINSFCDAGPKDNLNNTTDRKVKSSGSGVLKAGHRTIIVAPRIAFVLGTEKGDYMANIPETGFMRLSTILEIIPVSKSRWWTGVKTGQFPKAYKLSERITVWRAEDIRALIENVTEIEKDEMEKVE